MDTKLRAWWSFRQGLDGSLMGKTAREVLTWTGWSRSVAGASRYLTLFARSGLHRAAVDTEIAKLKSAIVKALSEGVKKGLTTTLPLAFGLLQSEGAIRSVRSCVHRASQIGGNLSKA
jgi:hypothetical protein